MCCCNCDRDWPLKDMTPNIKIANLRPVGSAVPSGASLSCQSPQVGDLGVWT